MSEEQPSIDETIESEYKAIIARNAEAESGGTLDDETSPAATVDEPQATETPTEADARQRDEQGRFAKKADESQPQAAAT